VEANYERSAPFFDPAALDAYELAARVGEPASADGQTEILVHGDGTVVAVQRGALEKEAQEIRYRLDLRQAEFVMRSATQFDWTDRFPSRPGIPDEPIVHWQLKVPGGKAASARMWLRDAERGKLTGEILALLRQVLEQASDGRMYL